MHQARTNGSAAQKPAERRTHRLFAGDSTKKWDCEWAPTNEGPGVGFPLLQYFWNGFLAKTLARVAAMQ